MTEREKMLAGGPYNSRDGELMQLYRQCREVLSAYNIGYTLSVEERMALLGRLLGKVAEGVWIEPPFFCDYGCHIAMAENTFVNFNCVFLDCNTITIGRNVLIGPAVQIYAVSHPLPVEERISAAYRTSGGYPVSEQAVDVGLTAPVAVGDNVWIGGGAILLPGVSIGEGSVIGAGAVVTRDIPSGVLACGNPCRVVKKV